MNESCGRTDKLPEEETLPSMNGAMKSKGYSTTALSAAKKASYIFLWESLGISLILKAHGGIKVVEERVGYKKIYIFFFFRKVDLFPSGKPWVDKLWPADQILPAVNFGKYSFIET